MTVGLALSPVTQDSLKIQVDWNVSDIRFLLGLLP